MSPKYGFGTQVRTRSTRLSSLMVPLTRYLSSAVNDTMVSGRPSSVNAVAEASSASAAAFRKPCGDIQMSSCRTSALAGWGTGSSPASVQVYSPAVKKTRCCSPCSGVPPPSAG